MAANPKKTVRAELARVNNPAADLDKAAEVIAAAVEPIAQAELSARTAIEKGVAETRAIYVSAKSSADDTASAFELSFAAAKDGAIAISAQTFDAFRTNTEANLDFVRSAITAKSLADLWELHSDFARKQVQVVSGQLNAITELSQRVVAESFEPLRVQMAKSVKAA